jgi:hypothetical protein
VPTQDSTPTPEQRASSIVAGTALSTGERDALYVAILNSLRSIDQISYYLDHGEPSQTRRLRKRFEGEMALLDHIGWERTSTRKRFPISMPAERLQKVIRTLLEYTHETVTHETVTSPEITALRLAEAVLEKLDQQANARILASSDAR